MITGNELINNDSFGLTIRQYYAGLAMQGLLASYGSTSDPTSAYVGNKSVELADSLIKALNKDSDKPNK